MKKIILLSILFVNTVATSSSSLVSDKADEYVTKPVTKPIDRFCNALFTHDIDVISEFGSVLKINGFEHGIKIDRHAILELIRSLPSSGLADDLSNRFRNEDDLSFNFIECVLSQVFLGREMCPCCLKSLAIGSTEEEINGIISTLLQLFNIFTSDRDIISKLKEAKPFIKSDITAILKEEVDFISKPENKEEQKENIHNFSGKILSMIFVNEMKLNYLKQHKEKFEAINMAAQRVLNVVAEIEEYKAQQEKAKAEKKAAKKARQKDRRKQEQMNILSQPSTSAEANALNEQSSESDDDIIVLEMDNNQEYAIGDAYQPIVSREEKINQELKNLSEQLIEKYNQTGNSMYLDLAQRCEYLIKTSDNQEKEKFRIYIRTNFIIYPEEVE